MQIDATNADLRNIEVDRIDRNPENPRIVFRPADLEELLESIRRYGVQVPISVYKERDRFVLIDGERRWRCSLKLNKKTIPALVQDKPDALTNLLLMFNIHALREQWDLLTIALKLPRVIQLLTQKDGRKPNERQLAEHTGLARAIIRRCKLLIELPDPYKSLILEELNRPKPQQKLTEDFFIEMERALKTVERAMPDSVPDKDLVRKVLINKYKTNVFVNRTDFRMLSKIARAERVDADQERAKSVLRRLFQPNNYSIESAYIESVSDAYSERDLLTRVKSLLARLDALQPTELDEEVRESLRALASRVAQILGRLE